MFVKKFAAAAVALITAVLALPLFINDASASHGTDARIHDVDFGVFAPGEITGEEALNPEITVVGPEKLQLSGGYIKVELTGGETSAFVCGWNSGGGYLAYGTSVQSKAWVRPVEGLSEGVHSAEMTLFFDVDGVSGGEFGWEALDTCVVTVTVAAGGTLPVEGLYRGFWSVENPLGIAAVEINGARQASSCSVSYTPGESATVRFIPAAGYALPQTVTMRSGETGSSELALSTGADGSGTAVFTVPPTWFDFTVEPVRTTPRYGTVSLDFGKIIAGSGSTSANIRIRTGDTDLGSAEKYLKSVFTSGYSGAFLPEENLVGNWAKDSTFNYFVRVKRELASGQYEATLTLFYDGGGNGSDWTAVSECDLFVEVVAPGTPVQAKYWYCVGGDVYVSSVMLGGEAFKAGTEYPAGDSVGFNVTPAPGYGIREVRVETAQGTVDGAVDGFAVDEKGVASGSITVPADDFWIVVDKELKDYNISFTMGDVADMTLEAGQAAEIPFAVDDPSVLEKVVIQSVSDGVYTGRKSAEVSPLVLESGGLFDAKTEKFRLVGVVAGHADDYEGNAYSNEFLITWKEPVYTDLDAVKATLAVPAAGELPDTAPQVQTEGVTAGKPYWYEYWGSYRAMAEGDRFAAGKKYGLRIVFETEELFRFAAEAVFTLNGESPDGLFLGTSAQPSSSIGWEWIFTLPPEETEPPVTTEEVTTAEVTTSEVTTAEVTTAEVTTAEVTTAEVTTEEVTTAEVTTAEVTTAEVTTAEVTTSEVTTSEITTSEITSDEVTGTSADVPDSGTAEPGSGTPQTEPGGGGGSSGVMTRVLIGAGCALLLGGAGAAAYLLIKKKKNG